MALNPAKRLLLTLTLCMFVLGIAGCRADPTPTPATPTSTSTLAPTATQTPTFTPTPTRTLAFTITPRPSNTPTITTTPFPSLSPTASPTAIEPNPAVLFPLNDINGKQVDWSYYHITQLSTDRLGEVDDLWAFLAFQLLDRGIYRRYLKFQDRDITIYYLNVAHEFNGQLFPMQLVLGGVYGSDVIIENIPAADSLYLQYQIRESEETFDPYIVHRDANRAYDARQAVYPLRLLQDFQTTLAALPDEVILLADHPILFQRDDWYQIKLDMSRVSALAARYQPFFEIADLDRLVDQSDFAYALGDHILNNAAMPEGLYAFSAKTIIIYQGEN
jgi:hypothetical protein